jgi:hypothetical protein
MLFSYRNDVMANNSQSGGVCENDLQNPWLMG